MCSQKWAEVAVDHPAGRRSLTLGQTFTYEVPSGLAVQPGQIVRAPFGPRQVLGVVFAVSDQQPAIDTRPISAVLDDRPWLGPEHIALARWLAEYYCASLSDAIRLMMPPGIQRSPTATLQLPRRFVPPDDLGLGAAALFALLKSSRRLSLASLQTRLHKLGIADDLDALLRELGSRGIVVRIDDVGEPIFRGRALPSIPFGERQGEGRSQGRERASPKGDTWNEAASDPHPTLSLPGRGGLVPLPRGERQGEGRSQGCDSASIMEPTVLTDAQEAIWQPIASSLGQRRPVVFLLHGVTASGKTEIYVRLIQEVLARGRRAIVLVPEIALTPQAIQRYAARFPGRVAVVHSRLSPRTRWSEWRRIRDGGADVVIGARSALFAPVRDLGAVVVDEEHEWSYKEDRPPCYHAREAAIKLGELASAPVILGSATPDVGTYARAQAGQYRLLELRERIAVLRPAGVGRAQLQTDVTPPLVEVVDLREELKAGNRSIFSRRLHEAAGQALTRHEQVIMFLNRRGAATFVMCRDCGTVLRCRRCDASLVYHSADDDLVCHLCNARRAAPDRCPKCRSTRIKFLGIGTERVEQEVMRVFPDARVLRWDGDTARSRGAHEEILRRFQAHEADVLVGSQMIAKGLDLPLVTVVGIVTADTSLHLPDLRAAERTFQLLTQVAGRAGRGPQPGRVILQTYTPEHYCVRAASHHDYAAFAAQELKFRREHGYPPFSQLALLLCSRAGEASTEREANRLADLLRGEIDRQGLPNVEVIGPAPSYRKKVRSRYRWQMLVRGQAPWVGIALRSVPLERGWSVDVDPVSVL